MVHKSLHAYGYVSPAVQNGIIYVIGGYAKGARTAGTADIESYNAATDTWTPEAPLAVAKSLPAVWFRGVRNVGHELVSRR